jgi:hypothetical protein
MFEELLETAGPWGIAAAALLILPGGRKFMRSAAKEVVRFGITASEHMKEVVAEVKEEASDVVAEVKAERKDHKRTPVKASSASKN